MWSKRCSCLAALFWKAITEGIVCEWSQWWPRSYPYQSIERRSILASIGRVIPLKVMDVFFFFFSSGFSAIIVGYVEPNGQCIKFNANGSGAKRNAEGTQ